MDPLSISAGVAGLISLGIQLSQSLIDYYSAYKSQFKEVNRTITRLQGLHSVLTDLESVLKHRDLRQEQESLVKNIESHVKDCEELLEELGRELQKLRDTPHLGFLDTVRSTGRRLAYPFRQSTLQKLEEDTAELRENLNLALAALQLDYGNRLHDDIDNVKEIVELVRASQLSSRISQWLKAPDATINFNEQCLKKSPSTGRWLMDSGAFTTWLEEKDSFLWLNGFAGCGKSVLSSTVIQHTLRRSRNNHATGIAFYYFTFREEAKQDVGGMLRALLLQLSNQIPDGDAILCDLENRYEKRLPPAPALLSNLQGMCQRFDNVYIILDALDECPRGEKQSELMDVLVEIRKSLNRGFHLLVTSRDEPDIREALGTAPHEEIRMKNAGVDKDIAAYVSSKLDNDRTLRKWSAYHEKIREALTEGACGV